MIPKALDRELYKLVTAYDEWIADDTDDADMLSAVAEFCRIVKYEIPSTQKSLDRQGAR